MPQYTVGLPDGKQMVVEADSEDAALSGAQNWFAQNSGTKAKPDTSMLGALSKGASDLVGGVGETVKDYISPEAGKAIQNTGIAKSNPNYQSASEEFIHPSDGADKHSMGLNWSALPRAAVEQAPGLATDVAGQYITKKLGPAAQWLANTVTFGARTAGNEAKSRAVARTGDDNAEPSADDKLTGLQSTLTQSALNKIGTNSIISPSKVTATGIKGAAQAAGNVGKAIVTEGATNAGQDAISQGFVKQGTDQPYDLAQTMGAGAMGALGGGMFSMPHAAKETITATRMRGQANDEHTAMAANRLIEGAGGNADALADPKVAYDATRGAVSSVNREINEHAKRVTNASPDALNAIDAAKDGTALTKGQLASVDAEGNDQLSSLVRQASALSKLTDMGNFDGGEGRFAGGASEFARKNARTAVYGLGGVAALPHMIGQGGVGLDSLSAAVPHLAEAAAAGYAGYRGLKVADKALGLASPAKTFAEKFGNGSGDVRVPLQLNQSPTGPKVDPVNSLTPAQPWGPVADKPTPFKPDMLDSNIAKIVEKIQNTKRRDTAQQAMPLLRQLAEQSKPPAAQPGPDVSAMNEQVKSALLMASARRKIEGQRQAEAEAEVSPMIMEQGGLGAVSNPEMGKRAQQLIGAANALARLRAQPEAEDAPPTAPTAPEPPVAPAPAAPTNPGPAAPPVRSMADILQRLANPTPEPEAPKAPEPTPAFTLPESPHVFKEVPEAAEAILNDAKAGGKSIRNEEGYKAGTARRLAGEEAIYNNISRELASVDERGQFHKYLSALWGSDSPEVVTQVRQHMLAEFPQHAATISKHLSDAAIKGLWTKPAKKK